MLFERIESEGLSHYSYLVGAGHAAAVIDPRRDCLVYAEKAARQGMAVRYVFETHRNEDYLSGSTELASLTGAEVWHADSQWPYGYGSGARDGQEWRIGPLLLKALLSPGHTPGMMSYLLHDDEGAPWVLFSGDALFAGDVGRVDFMGADRLDEMAAMLYATIFERLLPHGDGVILCPSHGPGSVCGAAISNRTWTTLGLERCHNPKLQLCEPFEFIAATARELEKPPYFARMERLNLEGPPPLGALPVLRPLGPSEFGERMSGAVVVDTRSPEAFAGGHIEGALSIWLDGLPAFAGWFLPYDKPLLLVVDEGRDEQAVRYLVRIGYDAMAGRLSGGMEGWAASGGKTLSTATIPAAGAAGLVDEGAPAWLLDVRSEEELEKEGAVPGAHHIHITRLPERVREVPRDVPVYVFCATGLRATIGASILEREGLRNVNIVIGGPPKRPVPT